MTLRFMMTCMMLMGILLGGCAAEVQSDEGGEPVVDVIEQDLIQAEMRCGEPRSFPTYTFWGETIADFTNQTSDGSTISIYYEVGLSGRQYLNIGQGSEPVRIRGRWAGMPLWITYLGWWDAAGIYRACTESAINPPTLTIQTY